MLLSLYSHCETFPSFDSQVACFNHRPDFDWAWYEGITVSSHSSTLTVSPQNYSCPSVMVLAVPVAVRFLQRGNRELSRNMSSYLSLAAIAKADLLAEHTEAITLSVLGGRTCLQFNMCFIKWFKAIGTFINPSSFVFTLLCGINNAALMLVWSGICTRSDLESAALWMWKMDYRRNQQL